MNGLTIGVLVFGILLLVVWLPILIVCQAGQRILVGVWIGEDIGIAHQFAQAVDAFAPEFGTVLDLFTVEKRQLRLAHLPRDIGPDQVGCAFREHACVSGAKS